VTRAYVSLGSNLGPREELLGAARAALMGRPGIRLTACSAVVETAPVDVEDQPDFLNQVLALDVHGGARELLDACLEIELELGRDRTRGRRRGPRTIDVDILLFGGRTIDEDGLSVPHRRLHRRGFLLELCRSIHVPAGWLPAPAPIG